MSDLTERARALASRAGVLYDCTTIQTACAIETLTNEIASALQRERDEAVERVRALKDKWPVSRYMTHATERRVLDEAIVAIQNTDFVDKGCKTCIDGDIPECSGCDLENWRPKSGKQAPREGKE